MTGGSWRVSIGNQTAFSAPPLEPFDYAVEHGFDAFEFFPDGKASGEGWMPADLSAETRNTIRSKAHDHGVRLSVHASLDAYPLSSDGVDAIARDMDLAHEIGARILVVHLVPVDLDAFAEGIIAAADVSSATGIQIAIENTIPMAPEDFNQLFARLSYIDPLRGRRVGMCLDIGHANLHVGTRNDYLAYVDRLAPTVPIVHLHAHENRGDADTHMTLFTGQAGQDPSGVEGLMKRLRRRDFAGSAILEQWPDPPSLLLMARERLKSIVMKTVTGEERRTRGSGIGA